MREPQRFESMDQGIVTAKKAGKTIRGSVFGVWFRFRANGSVWAITRKPAPSPARQIIGLLNEPKTAQATMDALNNFFGSL